MAKRAKQLDFLTPDSPQGQIIPTALHTEMQRSYLEYAMSVIVGRALPDVRDGLKPVHRRILFAMHELGLLPDRPYRKCARVVGDVLGKYHPHGDQSVYDALVRLVQDFSSRYPLLAGHGNFGSVDNDPPAAMRYTECRLAPIGNEALLGNLNESVIDFIDNFDSSQQEPTVLPAQLPMLLLNGASGIAVGMATNIPPHNLGEVVDGLMALIDHPDLPDEKLFELIPAPDFPTGGVLVDRNQVYEAYTTGKGSITLRGVATVENLTNGNSKGRKLRSAIVITELPFQVNKAAWIEKLAELANNGKLEGISDVRDESDRSGMRVVIEIKKEVNPEVLIEQLYRQTALQVNFGTIMLALVGQIPKQLSLREMLQEFISFREETLTRQYRYELGQAQQRLHLVDGLATVLADLDTLIQILRLAEDSASAKAELQTQFDLSETQADAILAMPLRRLTGMERQNLQTEMRELRTQITSLEKLLGDRRELLKTMKKELRALKKKHNDERRTQIVMQESPNGYHPQQSESEPESSPPPEVPLHLRPAMALEIVPEDTVLQITYKGYIKRTDTTKDAVNRSVIKTASDDLTIAIYPTQTNQDLILLTEMGKAFPLPVANIPATAKGSKARGTPLITLLPDAAGNRIVSHFPWDKNPETEDSLVLITTQAKIKRSPLAEFTSINSRGLVAMKIKDDDRLFWAGIVPDDHQIAIATSTGRILRMWANEEQVPTLGRTAIGNQAMRLRQSETLVATLPLDLENSPHQELLIVTAQGFAKRIRASSLRLSSRASIGTQAVTFKYKNDYLAIAVAIAPEHAHVLLLVAHQGDNPQTRTIQLPIENFSLETCNHPGTNLIELGIEPDQGISSNEKIADVFLA